MVFLSLASKKFEVEISLCRPEEVLKKEKEKQKEREIERQKEIQERLKLKRKQEAEVWEKRRRLLDNKALSQQVRLQYIHTNPRMHAIRSKLFVLSLTIV